MGNIKVLSSNKLLIFNGWENKKESLLIVGIFLIITIIGMIYAYISQGWIQNIFIIWAILLGFVLVYLFFSVEEIVFQFEDNRWIIVKRVIFYPVRRYSGKISNISALVSVEAKDNESLWTRLSSSDHISHIAILELKTFGQSTHQYNYYPIISKRSNTINTHKNNLMQFSIIGKAVIDIFSHFSLPLDFDIMNQNEIDHEISMSEIESDSEDQNNYDVKSMDH